MPEILSTVGAITSFKATTEATLVAEFDSAQAETTQIAVTKGTANVDGKATWNDTKTAVTFETTAKMSAGEYTITVTNGTASTTATTTVEDEKVASIQIKGDTALTGDENKEAYIYYDVLNQYGVSMRTSTTVSWTISSCSAPKVDKANGKITVKRDNGEVYKYGEEIYIVGVNVKSGVTIQTSVKVGMEQAIDTVKMAGFVNINDKTKKLDTLPADFAKNTYRLLYQSFDQNGNPLDAGTENIGGTNSKLTFVVDNVLLISSDLKDGEIFTIDGTEYSSVVIDPGMYVDKGGEVNITAISTKTGKKSTQNYVIGAGKVLKSLVLDTPAKTVADGDKDVSIPFTAKDTDGNTVTNYETIVRSTNTLSLSANKGSELKVIENNDGTARIEWSDNPDYRVQSTDDWNFTENPFEEKNGINLGDEQERNVSLSVIVVGGESSNLMLSVLDARRPSAIKSIKVDNDSNNTIVAGSNIKLQQYGTAGGGTAEGPWDTVITYEDQYGETVSTAVARAFFMQAASAKGFHDYQYGLKVVSSNDNNLGLDKAAIYGNANDLATIDIETDKELATVETENVKYSIAKVKAGDAMTGKITNDEDINKWEDASKVKTETYTIVPAAKVSNLSISDITKLKLTSSNSEYQNGVGIEDINGNVTGAAVVTGINNNVETTDATIESVRVDGKSAGIEVKGTYKGLKVTLPPCTYAINEKSDFTTRTEWNNKHVINGVKIGSLKWYELYNDNTAKRTRIDANKKLSIDVNDNSKASTDAEYKLATLTKSVTVSDEMSAPVKMELVHNYSSKSSVTNATETKISAPALKVNHWDTWWALTAFVYDQYDMNITDTEINYTVSDIKENEGAFAHVSGNFVANQNGTPGMNIDGAELGDTYTLKAALADYPNVTASIPVTVGSDTKAVLSSVSGNNTDKDFREKFLNYSVR